MQANSKLAPLLAALAIAAAVFASPAQSAETVLEELRNSLFEAVNEALRAANAQQSSLLAPTRYADGAGYYRRAEARLNDGGNIDSIRKDLERATESFLEAAEHAALAQTTFDLPLRARADAMSAGAEEYAREQWTQASESFANAALRLEKGRLERAQREGTAAELEFRAAELTAIKANYLTGTRKLIEEARKVRADRYAPRSFGSAKRLLEEAETGLTDNRYDTDRPRSLAQRANHDALHAIYVAGLEQAIRDRETTLEDVLMEWERSLSRIANLLDTPVFFDNGEEEAIALLSERVAELIADNARLNAALTDRQAQLDTLINETASMQQLSKLVARQERQKARLARVQGLFSDSEALVLRQDDSIILRLIGLNFKSGRADLEPAHDQLLSKLSAAISEFPESAIVIEGHTDAYGSDADNQLLSQRRADAVRDHLLENFPISPANVTALGYGESKPVANNETDDGRRRNRRIDVVIYPRW